MRTREQQQQYDRARREKAGRFGLCFTCVKRPARPEMRSCEQCSNKTTERVKAFYRLQRERVLAKFGNQCACCGEKEPKFLTIDHINGGGWRDRARNRQLTTFRQVLLGLRDDIRVLCFNCNSGRQLNSGICPHQG